MTGNVVVSGYPYGYRFWGTQADNTKGSYAAWWPYEQTAYWIDGALKCGYLAGRTELYQQALNEVDFAVEYAAADGFIGPDSLRPRDRWPHAVFFRAVLAQYEISGDKGYLDALLRHYRSMPHPLSWDRDVTGVEILLYLYQETGEADLLEMAEDLYQRFNAQYPDHDCSLQRMASEKEISEHGVTFNEESKLAAMLYTATGDLTYLGAVVHGYAKLEEQARLADGLHSSSEHVHGKTTRDMHETCNITDHAWALSYLLQATGDIHYADQIERIIYNALPGAITKDFRALQYFSAPNQVVATSHSNHNPFMRGLNWMSYRPDHEVQCCPGNVHRAMPNFVSRMWMRTSEGGIVAALYGPAELQTTAGKANVPVTITARTRYPFQQAVDFQIRPEVPVSFPFMVRIPHWCTHARLSVNGQVVDADLQPGSFFTLEQRWQLDDTVRLELPFELSLERWPDNGISLVYGPLTLSFPILTRAEVETENSTTRQRMETLGNTYVPRQIVTKKDFPAWNLYPDGRWNYALQLDENKIKDLVVAWNPDCQDPLDAANPAFRVRVPVRRVHTWRVTHIRKVRQFGHWTEGEQLCRGWRTIEGDFYFTPPLPGPEKIASKLSEKTEEVDLVPYGATMLRLTVFPQA